MRPYRFLGRLLVAAGLLSMAASASAQCPENLCDCLGNLPSFVVAGGKAKVGPGSYSEDGDRVVIGSSIDGSACFEMANLRGRIDGDGDVAEDLVLRNGTGAIAAKLRGYKEFGDLVPGFSIGGDIVTAGGSVRGTADIDYDLFGSLLLDPNDPRVLGCEQATLDMSTASTLLSAFPTVIGQSNLVVSKDTVLSAGPGVHVINISGELRIEPSAALFGNTLSISTDLATLLVVINVSGDVSIGDDATLTSDFPEQVIINVTGAKSKVKIGKRAFVDVPILAPNAAVLAQADSSVSNLWTNKKLSLLGASVSDALVCDPPEQPTKVVFVSSEEYDGATVGSLENADALCQQLAADELLSGTFKAWLSDSSSSAASRLSHAIVPYTLVDGTVVANNWTDLTDGALAHAIDQDESGISLDAMVDNLQVWTASSADGGIDTEMLSCSDWTTADDLEDGIVGEATSTTSDWSSIDFVSCDELAHLYCIQQ